MGEPITISARNAEASTGMSWTWVRRFARAHGVPILHVGSRKQLVPAGELLAAMRRTSEQSPEPVLTDAQQREAARTALARELAR
jgi:hypothetical protein